MATVTTTCSYCKAPMQVSVWDYFPSETPVDLYCPACGGRNNVNRFALLFGFAVLLASVLGALHIADRLALSGLPWLGVLGAGGLLGFAGAALAGAKLPKLVPYKRWWVRPPVSISEADSELMHELGIRHNGDYFICGTYHFDSLAEAVAHARQSSSVAP